MKKTNIGLVQHAHVALAEKWGYVWGTFGQVLTEALLRQKVKQYPSGVGNYLSFIRANWLGKKTCDCIGLMKSYIFQSDNGEIKYDSTKDISADMAYNRAKERGIIDSMPEIPGICVWKKGHIGVYIGNGWVIEAAGTKRGVVKTPLKGSGSTGWTHWLKHPHIEYVTEEVKPTFLTLSLNGVDYKIDAQTNINGSLFVGIRELFTKLGYKDISYDERKHKVVVK